MSVTPEEFEKQMGWLKSRGYTGVSVREGLMSLPASAGGEAISIPRKDGQIPIVITFDDGYLDNHTNAFPVLKKFGFSATVYVITNYVGSDSNSVSAEFPRRRGNLAGTASKRIFLNWDEIIEMHRTGIEIGSHTATHSRLTTVNRETVASELIQSKEAIEKKLGISCNSFCYPGGMWNGQIEELVRQAGYQNAATVMPGANFADGNLFRLRRTEISGDDSLFEFEKKLAGAYDLLHAVWQKAGNLK